MSLVESIPAGATVVVDSGPIIIVLDGTDRALAGQYLPIFKAAERGRLAIAVSTITVAEVMTGPLRHGDRILAERYRQVMSASTNWRVIDFTLGLAALAADLRAKYRLKLPDAIQLATAIDAGAHALVTHDRDFAAVTELPVISRAHAR